MDDDDWPTRLPGHELCPASQASYRQGREASSFDTVINSTMGTAVVAAPVQPRARRSAKLLSGDQVSHLITFIFAASVFLVTVLVVYELWIHSGPSRAK